MAAQRKDAYEQYISANRNDLAEIEKAEYDVITPLLPRAYCKMVARGETH